MHPQLEGRSSSFSRVIFLEGIRFAMFSILVLENELHAKGLPKWMSIKNIDHLSAKEKTRIVSYHNLQLLFCHLVERTKRRRELARKSCSRTQGLTVPAPADAGTDFDPCVPPPLCCRRHASHLFCCMQLHHADQQLATAEQTCLKTKVARCIFAEPKE